MPPLDRLSAWAATHHGVIDLGRLRALGFHDHDLRRLCALGVLQRVRRGLYLVAAVPPTDLQQVCLAVAATVGTAWQVTAGRIWGLRRLPHDPLVRVLVPYGRDVRRSNVPGVVVSRTRCVDPVDVVRRADGIAVTSPPRTLFDLAAVVDRGALESMVEQVLDRYRVTVPTLWATARRLAVRGRPGSGRFVDVLASRPAWRKPVGSDLELRLERWLVAAGLPAPQRQPPIRLPGGHAVHPDLVWPRARLVVEVDHVTWHGGRVESTYDKWRDRQLRLLSWEVDRVTDEDLRDRPGHTVADLVQLHDQRLASVGAAQDRAA